MITAGCARSGGASQTRRPRRSRPGGGADWGIFAVDSIVFHPTHNVTSSYDKILLDGRHHAARWVVAAVVKILVVTTIITSEVVGVHQPAAASIFVWTVAAVCYTAIALELFSSVRFRVVVDGRRLIIRSALKTRVRTFEEIAAIRITRDRFSLQRKHSVAVSFKFANGGRFRMPGVLPCDLVPIVELQQLLSHPTKRPPIIQTTGASTSATGFPDGL